MPLYLYECLSCHTRRECFRAVKDRDWHLPACVTDKTPDCLGTPMSRVLTPPNLKGETVSKC